MTATVSELLAHDVIEASHGRLPPAEVVPQEPSMATVGVQINGKTYCLITMLHDATPDEAMATALADYRIANRVSNTFVSVEKYKPGCLLNLKAV